MTDDGIKRTDDFSLININATEVKNVKKENNAIQEHRETDLTWPYFDVFERLKAVSHFTFCT
jgi:hypothetical protein